MGAQFSADEEQQARDELASFKDSPETFAPTALGKTILTYPNGLLYIKHSRMGHFLSRHSILSPEALESEASQDVGSTRESRALACMMCNVIGDALGAPVEFLPIQYKKMEQTGFDPELWKGRRNRFQVLPGQWTDDASMALCILDSLLVKSIDSKKIDCLDLRHRFLLWCYMGYNNSFGYNTLGARPSVGLGGNISMSMRDFQEKQLEATRAGDRNTSGNGSIMRNAPVPLFHAKEGSVADAMEMAYKQSKTTHQGDEAAECCRLLTFVTLTCIQHVEEDPSVLKQLVYGPGGLLETDFKTDVVSVQCLATSVQEPTDGTPFDPQDRNWIWRADKYKYSPSRTKSMPGYMGSYAMDGLTMSLHCIWTTNSLRDAMVKAASLQGDADTVCAITAQMAGALYGLSEIPADWTAAVKQWDPQDTIWKRARMCYNHQDI
eukprot:m.12419 g.12419  ORF g.12419 m.12419 type:complete len:436 (+) comp5824_c0_seq2:129-1436(+)